VPVDTDVDTYELGQDEIGSDDQVTLGPLRALAKRRGWSEDWLVEQCKPHMDNPRATIREILDGLTKPEFMGSNVKPRRVNLKDTVLVRNEGSNPPVMATEPT
jgi:hypothetical protein